MPLTRPFPYGIISTCPSSRLEKADCTIGRLSGFFPAQAEEVLDSSSSEVLREESVFRPTLLGEGLMVTGMILLYFEGMRDFG